MKKTSRLAVAIVLGVAVFAVGALGVVRLRPAADGAGRSRTLDRGRRCSAAGRPRAARWMRRSRRCRTVSGACRETGRPPPRSASRTCSRGGCRPTRPTIRRRRASWPRRSGPGRTTTLRRSSGSRRSPPRDTTFADALGVRAPGRPSEPCRRQRAWRRRRRTPRAGPVPGSLRGLPADGGPGARARGVRSRFLRAGAHRRSSTVRSPRCRPLATSPARPRTSRSRATSWDSSPGTPGTSARRPTATARPPRSIPTGSSRSPGWRGWRGPGGSRGAIDGYRRWWSARPSPSTS